MIYTDTELCKLLPPWYREVLDYQALCQAEQPVFQDIKMQMQAVLDNFFPQTMDVSAVEQWEDTLHILADPDSETLDFRRWRIINRISTKPPFTLQFLYNKLDELLGKGMYTIDVDYGNYTLYIYSEAKDQQQAQEIIFTVNHIKPAHIVFIFRQSLQIDLIVNEAIGYSRGGNWNYKLGQWALGAQPFGSVLEGEVVKTANESSIQQSLINGMTADAAAMITSARINGTAVINALYKTQQDGVLTVSYTVSPSTAETITQVELLAADGTVLTSASVYIPVAAVETVQHKITLEEGVNHGSN